jgi:hypothetical protein
MDDDTHKGYLLFPAAANATPMPTFSDPTSDNYIRRAFLMRLKGISADPLTIACLRTEYTLKKIMGKLSVNNPNLKLIS